ncbi:MAG: putative S-layer protein, partial [Nanoarchaeota archaeon]|nr:putative S-layer protein [Nanoarchaeota archaeon]
DKILVTLENSALGIAEKMVIDNLRSGKRKEIEFFFDVPAQLLKDAYNLEIKTYYDYDEDEDALDEFSYGENSDDDLSKSFSTRLEILSCKGPEPAISAGLESEAIVGTDLVIKALVTNNDDNDNFAISVSDYESWANLVSITPQTASINKGESKEVLITFAPTIEGAHSFKINTVANGETYDQLVSVNVAEKPGLFSGMSNKLLYVIAGIAAVLILIFAVIILRVKRRSVRAKF